MKLNKNAALALAIPLIIFFLLSRIGLININFSTMLYFISMLGGFSVVLILFGEKKRILLFSGTALFLGGFVMLIKDSYIFTNSSDLFLPAIVLIIGIGMLILYIEDTKTTSFAYAAIIITSFGIGFIIKTDSFSIGKFLSAIGGIIAESWILLLITFLLAAIIFSLYKK
jgi:hypothetical protein